MIKKRRGGRRGREDDDANNDQISRNVVCVDTFLLCL